MQLHPELTRALSLAQQRREPEALALIEQLAATGEPDALFTLADAHWRGVLVPQNLERAFELFGEASNAGQPMAVRAYTNLLGNGIAGRRDWDQARNRLRGEARQDGLRAKMLTLLEQMDLTSDGDPQRVLEPEILSQSPEIWIFRQAFTQAECDFLVALAQPSFQRSTVVLEHRDVEAHVRTSDGATIHWLIEDPATHALNRRIAALSGTRVEQGEPLYILRYHPGQEYKPHLDWLPGGNPRILTALVYLNQGYSGGETLFTKIGLRVKGQKGDALVFRSQGLDGGVDPLSEHAGLPVTSGVKFIGSRWIRANKHVER